jgi:hypothetical protein
VTVEEAVSRIAGIATVEALLLFSSTMALELFIEGFLPDGESPASGRELEAAFKCELRTIAGVPAEEAVDLRFPVFGPGSLLGAIETVSSGIVSSDEAGESKPAPTSLGLPWSGRGL